MNFLRQGFRLRSSFGGQVSIAILLLPTILIAQQRDARTTPLPVGTGEISGIVWTADATPQPLRRVIVSIAGGDLLSVRSVLTDDGGKFTFGRLNAGTFTITAKKQAYLPAAHGSMRPGRPGSPIVLAAGQRLAINVTMFKGAVIAGTLRDASGLPVPGVSVSVVDVRAVSGAASPTSSMSPPAMSTVTDDRGAYRLFGLMPGEYLITASPSPSSDGAIGARSAAELDAVLATLSQRQVGVTTASVVAPSAPPPLPLGTSVSYAPIYFPGTAWYSEAATIKVAPGDEREGVNFEVGHVRVATVTGTVSGDVANLAAVEMSLIFAGPRSTSLISTGGVTHSPPDARGEFKFGNMPPGQYRIVARAKRGAAEAVRVSPGVQSFSSSGGSSAPVAGGGSPLPNADQLFAVADFEVRGQDIAGLGLQLQTGGTLSGKLVFNAATAPVPADLSAIRVQLLMPGGSYTAMSGGTRVGNSLSQVNPVVPGAGGTFQFIGIGPGPYTIACQLPPELAKVWTLRSAMADGRELLDGLIDGPAVQMTGVTLTLSDRRTELGGNLQSPTGQPTTDYYVIVFAADRAHWRPGSRRSLSAKPGTDGRFAFADLPAGEYLMAALTDLDPMEWQTPAFLEQVAPAAIKVVVAEGQKNVQDMRIR